MKIKIFPKGQWYKETAHGPKVWPWWRMFSARLYKAAVHRPSTGYNLWIYTRWGAKCVEIYFDRRNLASA